MFLVRAFADFIIYISFLLAILIITSEVNRIDFLIKQKMVNVSKDIA